MHTYKFLKRKDNVKYYLGINRVNSRTATIEAYWVKLNKTDVAATVNLKNNKVTLAEGWSSLPQEVIDAIEGVLE